MFRAYPPHSYTITYTPSEDRILPCPPALFVRIKNTAALALRAAYLHGPYTLHTAVYPAGFDPNVRLDRPERVGVPQFEPYVKAGGSWVGRLSVPEDIRTSFGALDGGASTAGKSATWIVEVASQIMFSHSASVSFDLLVSRDERSLDFGLVSAFANADAGTRGSGDCYGDVGGEAVQSIGGGGKRPARRAGIYSESIKLVVEDTQALWNKPALPGYGQGGHQRKWSHGSHHEKEKEKADVKRRKNIHLVMVTHGLHSNTGADLLFLKESIDVAAKKAKEDRRIRKSKRTPGKASEEDVEDRKGSTREDNGSSDSHTTEEDESDEDVIVRGFHGNAVRTEKGIQYLGKRLAKYILQLTYPDQPFLPVKKSVAKKISNRFSYNVNTNNNNNNNYNKSAESESTQHDQRPTPSENMEKSRKKAERLAHKYTSISFVGHSLGGLIQTYAIAYIQKHSPHFFDLIKPINFIALASPMLGLSNENPVYVKFALDFGLVGRTGQDLGLFWRPPAFARTGWGAVVGNFGGNRQRQQQDQQADPRAKPLLRILPTGPAHQVLKKFRNRTLYCNAVNDGIVPLRTSCLLFLDWRGLDKVDKARRENGLIGTVAGWGWAEITGANAAARVTSPTSAVAAEDKSQIHQIHQSDTPENGSVSGTHGKDATEVPQPPEGVTTQEESSEAAAMRHSLDMSFASNDQPRATNGSNFFNNPIHTLLKYIRPVAKTTDKDYKMYRRSQTIKMGGPAEEQSSSSGQSEERKSVEVSNGKSRKRPIATKGDSLTNARTGINAPPKTTVFESATDILSPSFPSTQWLIDPEQRGRTIFHDRVYHPDDIPPPPSGKRPNMFRSLSSASVASATPTKTGGSAAQKQESQEPGTLKVEEKIARAYHRDMSWRKVLVRLEPDAHNNIIVRRMFSNAYGWPVIKHLCDTHFADTFAARTDDADEPAMDRANTANQTGNAQGEEVTGQSTMQVPVHERSQSESREATDELKPLGVTAASSLSRSKLRREHSSSSSTMWDDAVFEENSDDDDIDFLERRSMLLSWSTDEQAHSQSTELRLNFHGRESGSGKPEVADRLVQSPDVMESSGILDKPVPEQVNLPQDSEDEPVNDDARPEVIDISTPITGNFAQVGLHCSMTDKSNPSSPVSQFVSPESKNAESNDTKDKSASGTSSGLD